MPASDILKTLHTAMLNTMRGYEEAEKDAETPVLKNVFGGMVEMRRTHHEELHRALVALGETANDDGSFMGRIHRTVIGVRAKVIGLGRDSLSAFASGEEKNLADYDEAIAVHADDAPLIEVLRAQKAALQERVIEMKRLAASA